MASRIVAGLSDSSAAVGRVRQPLLHVRRAELGFGAVVFAAESIRAPTEWRIEQDRLTLIVHLHGAMQRLETRVHAGPTSRRPARPGEIWLLPAGSRYTGLAQGGRIAYAELSLDPRWLAELLPGRDATPCLATCLQQPDPALHALIVQLGGLMEDDDAIAAMMRETLLRLIGLHLLRQYASAPQRFDRDTHTPRPLSPALHTRLVDYIDAHLDQPISLSDLAQLSEVSPQRLIEGFHAGFGTTPAQYIIDQRLQRAARLLGNGHRSIAQVALDTGFSSHSHLTSIFRQRYGMTPTRYRTELSEDAACAQGA